MADPTNSVDESDISVRFKHGIHTIYLFVDSNKTMKEVTTELLSLLRERYPDGLTTSVDPPKTTTIPSETEAHVAYGVLKVPSDPTRGWKQLQYDHEHDTNPVKAGLKSNGIVAFSFLEKKGEDAVFEVEWPVDDEEAYNPH